MEFVAIDFETANNKRDSACSLGMAFVSDGRITETRHWLIRPKELHFNPRHVRIHGITEATVADKPQFCDLWDEILPSLSGRLVIAHNAGFDMSVLRRTLDCYGMGYPELDYSCSYQIARQVWCEWVCFKLPALAAKLNLNLDHHDAMEDAKACAEILLAAAKHIGVSTFDELEESTSVYRGRLERDCYYRPSCPRVRGERSPRNVQKYIRLEGTEVDPRNPLYERVVVFTGTVPGYSKADAEAVVKSHGGIFKRDVTRKTNFVVFGEFDLATLKPGAVKSENLVYAEELASKRFDIEIMDVMDFERLLSEYCNDDC
jgi:DNA polymerase-3 subunit epsilon